MASATRSIRKFSLRATLDVVMVLLLLIAASMILVSRSHDTVGRAVAYISSAQTQRFVTSSRVEPKARVIASNSSSNLDTQQASIQPVPSASSGPATEATNLEQHPTPITRPSVEPAPPTQIQPVQPPAEPAIPPSKPLPCAMGEERPGVCLTGCRPCGYSPAAVICPMTTESSDIQPICGPCGGGMHTESYVCKDL